MTQSNNSNNTLKADLDYGAIPVMDAIAGPATILDQKDPLVVERENAQKRKNLGVSSLITLVLVGRTAAVAIMSKGAAQAQDLKSLLENRFASLLVDDQAFFFPSSAAGGK